MGPNEVTPSAAATATLRVGLVLLLGLLPGLGVGCSSGSDKGGSDDEPGTTAVGPPTTAIAVPPVTFDQKSVLSDGVVSDEEMEAALDAAVACMEGLGVLVTVEPVDVEAGLAGGWSFELAVPSEASSQVVSACSAVTVGDLEVPFLVGSEAESRAGMEAMSQCLEAAGVAEDAESLAQAMQDGGPLQDCAGGS